MAIHTALIAAPRLSDQPLSSETAFACNDHSWLGGGYREVHVSAGHPATAEVVGEAREVGHADNRLPPLVDCRVPAGEPLEHVMCEVTCGTTGQDPDTQT